MTIYRARKDAGHRIVTRVDELGRWRGQEYRRPGRPIYYGSAPDREPFDEFEADSEEELLREMLPHIGDVDELEIDIVIEGWPGWPLPPYVTPPDAPPIKVGQWWRRGAHVVAVRGVRQSDAGTIVDTRTVVSAKPRRGRQIVNRKSVDWPYSEGKFRSKFKLIEDEPVRPCPECGSDELCRPDCSVAPWNLDDTPPVPQ